MSAALRTPANDRDLYLLSDRFDKHSAPAFTAINARSVLLSSLNLAGSECVTAWERIRQKFSYRQTSESINLTTPAGERPDQHLSKSKRSHSNETGDLITSLGNGTMLARPFLTTSSVERKPKPEICPRSLAAREASCHEHCANFEIQDHEGDQRHRPGTLELPHANVPLVREDTLSEHNGSIFDETRHDQRCDQVRARKRRAFANRTKTGCGTCRKRKKKCDEAKPSCKNCLHWKFECADYIKEILLSKNNSIQVAPALHPLQQTHPAESPAHVGGYPVCDIIHIPRCEPSQMNYVEPPVSSGIPTAENKLVCTGDQCCKPL